MIIVRNTSDDTINARFCGQDYVFPAKKDTPCDEQVAQFVFGYGMENKDAALLRLGWVTPGQTKEQALKRLDQIVFKTATVRIEVDGEPVEGKGSKAA